RIAQAAFDFGFCEESGIEIFEEAGIVATVEYRTEKYGGWWDADTLITAIGQGDNLFTPVQMANYAATIANGGTLYDMSLLRAVKTSDYTATVINRTPTVRSQIEEIEYVAYLKEGMRAVVTYGTAREVFSDYEVAVAAKTGTVQTGSDFNDGVFICYAPADNPQIAISVVVEKGGSGAAIMDVAKLIFDEYFRIRATANAVNEGVLIP
ncbi:MAG: penicillin-binding protein A, partial [Clostridiales bacterium]|nr:penicillin-binding protein A [Clostridiales bacterium]